MDSINKKDKGRQTNPLSPTQQFLSAKGTILDGESMSVSEGDQIIKTLEEATGITLFKRWEHHRTRYPMVASVG